MGFWISSMKRFSFPLKDKSDRNGVCAVFMIGMRRGGILSGMKCDTTLFDALPFSERECSQALPLAVIPVFGSRSSSLWDLYGLTSPGRMDPVSGILRIGRERKNDEDFIVSRNWNVGSKPRHCRSFLSMSEPGAFSHKARIVHLDGAVPPLANLFIAGGGRDSSPSVASFDDNLVSPLESFSASCPAGQIERSAFQYVAIVASVRGFGSGVDCDELSQGYLDIAASPPTLGPSGWEACLGDNPEGLSIRILFFRAPAMRQQFVQFFEAAGRVVRGHLPDAALEIGDAFIAPDDRRVIGHPVGSRIVEKDRAAIICGDVVPRSMFDAGFDGAIVGYGSVRCQRKAEGVAGPTSGEAYENGESMKGHGPRSASNAARNRIPTAVEIVFRFPVP